MSLLLEALKKAEQAKQGETTQQPGARTGAGIPAGEGLSLAPEDAPAVNAPRTGPATPQPITRDRLPDITQNLEILPDDLSSSGTGASPVRNASPGRGRTSERSAAGTTGAPTGRMTESDVRQRDTDRAAAKQLFEAHSVDYDPRRPFKLVLVGLLVAGVGIVGYFWWQTQPRGTSFAQRPPPAPPSQQIASAPTATPAPQANPPSPVPQPQSPTPAPAPAAVEPPAAQPATQPVAPMQPPASAVVPTPPQPMPAVRPTSPPAQPAPRVQTAPQPAADPLPGARGTISISRSQRNVDAALKGGYSAIESGDLATARTEYDRALRGDPLNRDALLGLAALDIRVGDFDRAAARYARVLELDPRDAVAAAGLIGLRGTVDPVQAESRLKSLLAAQPDSAILHFALGNIFAAQSRWADAQQSYFRAAAAEPENPDFTFNLAVSLDQLHKEKLALEHYQRAMALAASRSAGFNKPQAEARIRDLQR